MTTYDTYKDSGIAWLGQIPSHWKSRKFKFTFSERNQKGFPNEPLLAATQLHGVIPKDLYENRTVTATKDLENLKLVEIGDFVISLRSFQGGIEYAYYRGIISTAYTIITPTAIKAQYFKYLGKSTAFIALLKSMVTGIREGQNIDYSKLRENLLPIPTIDEQQKIASYLDKETYNIDAAISQQQRMIDLLKERKQIIINEAVTHGLDPNAPMKPTGIDWLPQIPAHWDMRRLKYAFQLIGTKSSGNERKVCLEHIESWTGRILDIDVQNDGNGVIFEQNDILFGKLRPYLAKVYLSEFKGQAVGDIYVLRCEDILDCKYAHLLLICKSFIDHIDSSTYGTKMPRTNWTFVGNTIIPIPPKKDQINIVNKITSQLNPIDKAIKQCERMIELLTERKQIVINDVVTGKIKVS